MKEFKFAPRAINKTFWAVFFYLIFFSVSSFSISESFAAPVAPGCPVNQIHTELGDFCPDPQILVQRIIQIVLGITGGFCLILVIAGAGKYMLSSGNPEGMEEAKSIITQAFSGLILVILSAFIVRLVGIDVLGLPGLVKLPGGGFEGQ